MKPTPLRAFHTLTVLCSPMACGPAAQETEAPHYLFSYFTGNGEDGLHLAHSRDGLTWEAVNGGETLLTPAVGEARLMRDPSIVRGPDGPPCSTSSASMSSMAPSSGTATGTPWP